MAKKLTEEAEQQIKESKLDQLLELHDEAYEQQMKVKKRTVEWKELQEYIIFIRKTYNEAVGRNMFQI